MLESRLSCIRSAGKRMLAPMPPELAGGEDHVLRPEALKVGIHVAGRRQIDLSCTSVAQIGIPMMLRGAARLRRR